MYTVRINQVAINVIEIEIVDKNYNSMLSAFYQNNGEYLSEDQEIEDFSDQDTIDFDVFVTYGEATAFINEFLYNLHKKSQ